MAQDFASRAATTTRKIGFLRVDVGPFGGRLQEIDDHVVPNIAISLSGLQLGVAWCNAEGDDGALAEYKVLASYARKEDWQQYLVSPEEIEFRDGDDTRPALFTEEAHETVRDIIAAGLPVNIKGTATPLMDILSDPIRVTRTCGGVFTTAEDRREQVMDTIRGDNPNAKLVNQDDWKKVRDLYERLIEDDRNRDLWRALDKYAIQLTMN